jgi:hypothetical protein
MKNLFGMAMCSLLLLACGTESGNGEPVPCAEKMPARPTLSGVDYFGTLQVSSGEGSLRLSLFALTAQGALSADPDACTPVLVGHAIEAVFDVEAAALQAGEAGSVEITHEIEGGGSGAENEAFVRTDVEGDAVVEQRFAIDRVNLVIASDDAKHTVHGSFHGVDEGGEAAELALEGRATVVCVDGEANLQVPDGAPLSCDQIGEHSSGGAGEPPSQ